MPKKTEVKSKGNERVSSGIQGFDKLIEGGFFKGSAVLVSGEAGAGKTIFCAQFIMDGLRKGESCMFITLEEKPEDIIGDVIRFGWDFQKYMDSKQLILEYQDPFQITDIASPLIDKIKERKVQRVAVDSTAVFGMYYKDPFEVRKQLFKLISGLKDIGVTCVLTSEVPEDEKELTRFGVEEFVTDGLIILRTTSMGKTVTRTIEARKMRRTVLDSSVHTFDFTKNGIVVD
jgi:circadian clock protein KaiC